jgi:hypothetical protein
LEANERDIQRFSTERSHGYLRWRYGEASSLDYRAVFEVDNQGRIVGLSIFRVRPRGSLWEATIAEQKTANIHVKDGTTEAEYVKVRSERDRTLPLPDRILHALQVNLRGGRLPEPESDGHRYLRIPLNRF